MMLDDDAALTARPFDLKFGVTLTNLQLWTAPSARVPQCQHFNRASRNTVVKKVVNPTQMKTTDTDRFGVYGASTDARLRSE